MSVRTLYFALWISQPVLQSGIAALMVWRGQHRKFPFFFGYILTQLCSFSVLFPAYLHNSQGALAFYVYWGGQAISVAFGFGVIHEVFIDVFRAFHTLRDLGTVLFKWAGLVMLLVAGVVSVSTNSTDIEPWFQAIMTTQRCVRIIQVGMVLFLLFFASYMGVSRRQRSFGIGLGFGSFAIAELVLVASWVGHHLGNPWMSIVNMIAYNCSLMVWLGYCALKTAAREDSQILLRPQRWEQSLSDAHHPLPADSLIPMFEGMVDRALSRTQPSESAMREPGVATGPAWKAERSSGGIRFPNLRVTTKS